MSMFVRMMALCEECRKTGVVRFKVKNNNSLVLDDPEWAFRKHMLVHTGCKYGLYDSLTKGEDK